MRAARAIAAPEGWRFSELEEQEHNRRMELGRIVVSIEPHLTRKQTFTAEVRRFRDVLSRRDYSGQRLRARDGVRNYAANTREPVSRSGHSVSTTPAILEPIRGRPSLLTPELAETICGFVAEGHSVRAIAAMDGMPEARTIHRWVADRDDFRRRYLLAKEWFADRLGEEIIEIADGLPRGMVLKRFPDGSHCLVPTASVARDRIRIKARQWLMSKLAPRKYGKPVLTGQ